MFKYEINLWDTLTGVCYMGDATPSIDEAQVEFLEMWNYVVAQGDEHITVSMDTVEYDNQGFVGYVK